MPILDLRSDTVTLPTDAMRNAMARAKLGDDARDGDPTVRALETLAGQRTGKAAALFVPSGTMANLVALLAHAGTGGTALLHAGAHILRSEMGGIATVARLFPVGIPGDRGAMELDGLRAAIRSGMASGAMRTAVVCMETTHNQAGGAVLPLEHMAAVHAAAQAHGIPVHTDGARLYNAAIALGVEAERISRHTDSVAFCVSKGLSAPVGSLLAGSDDFIERARRYRRMLGGSMRQAGMLAAAGIVALEHMVERLGEDHERARELAAGLHAIDAHLVDPGAVETNIVRVDVTAGGRDAAYWSAQLAHRGVKVSPAGSQSLRFVTHRHVGQADVARVIDAFRDAWRGG